MASRRGHPLGSRGESEQTATTSAAGLSLPLPGEETQMIARAARRFRPGEWANAREGALRNTTGALETSDQFELGGGPTREIQKKPQSGLTAAGNRRILFHDNRPESEVFAQVFMRHRDSSLIRFSLSF
jgi:hypothetical protein